MNSIVYLNLGENFIADIEEQLFFPLVNLVELHLNENLI